MGIFYLFYIVFFTRLPSLDISFSNIIPLFVQFSAIAVSGFSAWVFRKNTPLGTLLCAGSIISTLILTSIYVQELTHNAFAVTIYNTLIATILIVYGIIRNIPSMRTAGLYIGIFVLAKILFYDIWATMDNLTIRVIALMVAGASMMTLSQLYGRHVSRSW